MNSHTPTLVVCVCVSLVEDKPKKSDCEWKFNGYGGQSNERNYVINECYDYRRSPFRIETILWVFGCIGWRAAGSYSIVLIFGNNKYPRTDVIEYDRNHNITNTSSVACHATEKGFQSIKTNAVDARNYLNTVALVPGIDSRLEFLFVVRLGGRTRLLGGCHLGRLHPHQIAFRLSYRN